MAVRKRAKSTPRKKSAGKGPARKTTAKKTPAKKAPSRSKAAAKPAARKAAPKPKRVERPAAAPAKAEAPKKAPAKPRGKHTAAEVNLGHVFGLRPRVSTSFRQADFLTARLLLEDESYASIQEAARAVADKALSLTNEPKSKRGKPGR